MAEFAESWACEWECWTRDTVGELMMLLLMEAVVVAVLKFEIIFFLCMRKMFFC